MTVNKKLLTNDIIEAYKNRFETMQKYKFSEKGDELFLNKMVSVSEQVNNLHVRAKINDLEIDNDGPKELVEMPNAPSPMSTFLACFANCLEITALLYFSYSNLKVNSVKVKVEATFDKRSVLDPKKYPLPGFYDINYTWFIDSEEKLKRLETVLEKVETDCPVKRTIRSQNFSQKIVLL